MEYNNLNELRDNTLQDDDFVFFNVDGIKLKYIVRNTHLAFCGYEMNDKIFKILKLDKKVFCDTHYGYYNYGGDWPTCKIADFSALTRVVKALYQEIDKREKKVIYLENKNLIPELKVKLNNLLSNPLLTAPLIEKKKDASSIISVKRKSKVKRIIGEEQIKLNNY